jgi:hypothetical protein
MKPIASIIVDMHIVNSIARTNRRDRPSRSTADIRQPAVVAAMHVTITMQGNHAKSTCSNGP